MKALKLFAFAFLFIIVFILITALFVSKEMKYEKSITVNAPIDSVWENVNSLADLDKWNPWNDYDSEMKKEITGTDGTVGAKQTWESSVKVVGKGSQTITRIKPPFVIKTDLKFYSPYKSEAKTYVQLHELNNKTKVTWGFISDMPYPLNIMKLFIDMEASVGKDWSKGLVKLKQLCEK